jgi:DNA-damage-inducible protein J
MSNGLVQFRADDVTKAKAVSICERLGIDLATYMRICMAKLVEENGIPFSMKLTDKTGNPGIAAMREASRIAEEQGISDLNLDEINAEISLARSQRKR